MTAVWIRVAAAGGGGNERKEDEAELSGSPDVFE